MNSAEAIATAQPQDIADVLQIEPAKAAEIHVAAVREFEKASGSTH
jgi:hypothetical protein